MSRLCQGTRLVLGGGLPSGSWAGAEGGHHAPGAFKAGGHGGVVEALEVKFAVGAWHVPDHGDGIAFIGSGKQARDSELAALWLEDGHPVDALIDEKLPCGVVAVMQRAGERFFRFSIGSRTEGGHAGSPGVHEVIDELQWHGFGGANGGRFIKAVVFELGDAGELEVANAGLALEAEGLALEHGFGLLDWFSIKDEGE